MRSVVRLVMRSVFSGMLSSLFLAAPSALGQSLPDSDHDRVEALQDRIEALEEALRQREAHPLLDDVVVKVHGYVDFGFFAPQGNGAGFVQDVGNTRFPE